MIRTRGLTRHFKVGDKTVEAVRGIDLDVQEGELVAFLGPNGAGKSTTLRMLTTLLHPTAGTAEVVGHDVVTEPAAVRQRIGSIGQGNGAGQSQRARDELVNQGRCYGLARRDAAVRADELLDALDLGELSNRVVNKLSGGQRRRLDIAMGMVHRPSLLFLDEPSTGLDPQNRANLKHLVHRLRHDHGTTIVLTTHYLDEADALADRVIVVDGGRVIADGTPQQLKSDLVGDALVVTAATHHDAVVVARTIERVGDARAVDVEGETVTARVRGGAALLPVLLHAVADHGVAVSEAEVARATLDDVFLALTGRSLRESAVAVEPSSEPNPSDPSIPPAPIFEEAAA